MIGVGGVVPVHICSWAPYLSQFQYHPNSMDFAIKTFFLMRIAVYIATLGAGGCKYTKYDILYYKLIVLFSVYDLFAWYFTPIYKGCTFT